MGLTFRERSLRFESPNGPLTGVLRYPDADFKVPGILMVHGSIEQDRDGNLLHVRNGKKVPPRPFFLEISKRICPEGFATFSWDKRGFGESPGDGSYENQAVDAQAALDILRYQDEVDEGKIAFFGQSAGVYVNCLMARNEVEPSAYLLSGGLYSDYKDMMSFNYVRVRDYARKSKAHRKWVETNDMAGLMIGENFERIVEAARSGKRDLVLSYKGMQMDYSIEPSTWFGELSPKRLFRHIRKPTLIVHGEEDLNVPVEDAWKLRDELHRNGTMDVEISIIPKADHSFQEVPDDQEMRLRERMSLQSFSRPYREEYFRQILSYLKRRLPSGT